MTTYALTLTRRYDGLFIACFPDLPEVTAYGRDDEEAVEEARIALDCALERRLSAGEALPPALSSGPLKVSSARYEPAL